MVVISVVFPVLLLLAAVLIQLAANGVLHRNRMAGIRVRATLSTDAAWVAGHKAAAAAVWLGFAVSAAAGLCAVLLDGWLANVFGGVVIVVLIATIAISTVQASRGARVANDAVVTGS